MTKRRRRSRHRFDNVPNVLCSRNPQVSTPGNPPHREINRQSDSSARENLPVHDGSLFAPSHHPLLSRIENPDGNDTDIWRNSIPQDSEDLPMSNFVGFPTGEAVEGALNVNVQFESPITGWRVLWALLWTSGSHRLTKEQYQSLRRFSQALVQDGIGDWKESTLSVAEASVMGHCSSYVPHYSTIYKSVKPVLYRALTVRSVLHQKKVDLRKSGAQSRAVSISGAPVISVQTVLASEYARADMAAPLIFDSMHRTSLEYYRKPNMGSILPRVTSTDCVDLLPIIAARNWFYGPPSCIFIDSHAPNVSPTSTAESGDIISVTLLAHVTDAVNESFQRCFVTHSTSSSYLKVRGKVIHVWMVSHANRDLAPSRLESDVEDSSSPVLSEEDNIIRDLFNYVTYTSPSDSITIDVPDLPEGSTEENDSNDADGQSAQTRREELKRLKRLRRNALDAKKRQMEQAWRDWEKPIIKPGDTIALLSPCTDVCEGHSTVLVDQTIATNTDLSSRILLVHRYWTEVEERNTHILWIPGGRDFDFPSSGNLKSTDDLRPFCSSPFISSSSLYAYAKEVALEAQHAERRGPQRFNAVSSFGKLNAGELYFVYRFVLFWDGFQVQDGKDSSGDGIYLLCMNLPTHSNRTQNDVRIISLTPPGVKSDTVLREVVNDIVKGMSEGFVDIDAHGQVRRIFLDLVGFIGDTPALNAFLDVLGHNACACCHLCRYVRQSSTLVGSRYTGSSAHGFRTAMQRGWYQQQAVRDCDPGREACRLLGLKPAPDGTSLVLHHLRSEIVKVRSRIPKTNEGYTVVPCDLDPYKACFIAPDHLLTGHLRDCISLAMKYVPSRPIGEAWESIMIRVLSDYKLPTQTRLINHEKRMLLSMTMSELYALGLVAHPALVKSLVAYEMPSNARVAQDKRRAALDILGSASRLITELWFKPDFTRDSTEDVRSFEINYGYDYLCSMRSLVDGHIFLVEQICSMDDNDAIALEESTSSREHHSALSRERALCALARRTIDKPNVHRLRELVITTLPMLGHVSAFGELALEKSHQTLKRAIRASNKKDAHLQAIENALFVDWQGRLTLSAPLALEGKRQDIMACYRLLAGREKVIKTGGDLNRCQLNLVADCINACVVKELASQGCSVLSKRLIHSKSPPIWTLKNALDVSDPREPQISSPNETQREAVALLTRFFLPEWAVCKVKCSDDISCITSARIPMYAISKGDIVETLTIRTETLDSHYPFVLQSSLLDRYTRSYRQHAPSLWSPELFFEVQDEHGKVSFFAVVRPCLPTIREGRGNNSVYHVAVDKRLRLAEMDSSMRIVPAIRDSSRPSDFFPLTRRQGFPPRQG